MANITPLSETRQQNEILQTTAEALVPRILENALDSHPAAAIAVGRLGAVMSGMLGEDGSPAATAARQMEGESIVTRPKLGSNPTAKRLTSDFDQFSSDTSNTLTRARHNWKLYAGTAVISGKERRDNRNMLAMGNLWKHKLEDAVSSVVDLFAQDIVASATATDGVTSLLDIISANDLYGGINGATYTAWNSRGLSAKGTAPGTVSFTSGSFTTQGISDMRIAMMNATEGSHRPNVILSNDAEFRYYEGSLTPLVRYEDTRVGNLSFENLKFKTAAMFHDYYVPSGTMLFWNTDTLYCAYSEGALFDVTEVMEQQFQDAFSSKVIAQVQTICEGRKFNNKMDTITA